MIKCICIKDCSPYYIGPYYFNDDINYETAYYDYGGNCQEGTIYYMINYGDDLRKNEGFPDDCMYISCMDELYPPNKKAMGIFKKENFLTPAEYRDRKINEILND